MIYLLSVVLILTLLETLVLNLVEKPTKLKDENKEAITDMGYVSTFVD